MKFNTRNRKKSSRRKSSVGVENIRPDQLIHTAVKSQKRERYVPENSFEDFLLCPALMENIARSGYETPTAIQDQSIDPALEGEDIVGIAGTGTGKTAAFLIPVIERLSETRQLQSTLILSPTRELASQTFEEFKKLTRNMKLFACELIGGTNINQNIKSLQRKNHVIIATPGRFIDLYKRGRIRLDNIDMFILDEFDRMLDMGFYPDVEFIQQQFKQKPQTLLFSATINPKQEKLIEDMTENAVWIKTHAERKPIDSIDQNIIKTPHGIKKCDHLLDVLKQENSKRVILFCDTKRETEYLFKKLKHKGIPAAAIHGDKSQRERQRNLDQFKQGRTHILVATDVLARGIDVLDVSLVINYRIPRNYNEYIHRIGRTGRSGKIGKALTFIN